MDQDDIGLPNRTPWESIKRALQINMEEFGYSPIKTFAYMIDVINICEPSDYLDDCLKAIREHACEI